MELIFLDERVRISKTETIQFSLSKIKLSHRPKTATNMDFKWIYINLLLGL